jgi:hypothetical protein
MSSYKINNLTLKQGTNYSVIPPVFNFYKFNLINLLIALISSITFAFVADQPLNIWIIDLIIGFSYIIVILVIKPLYANGKLLTAAQYDTRTLLKKTVAFLSQQSFVRMIASPVIFFLTGKFETSQLSPTMLFKLTTIGIFMALFVVLSPTGIFQKNKFYCVPSQEYYFAILKGPEYFDIGFERLLDTYYTATLHNLSPWIEPNDQYREIMRLVKESEKKIEKIANSYAMEWRARRLDIPDAKYAHHHKESIYEKLVIKALKSHNDLILEANKVIDNLNDYRLKTEYRSINTTESSIKEPENKPKSPINVAVKKIESVTKRDVITIWEDDASWY